MNDGLYYFLGQRKTKIVTALTALISKNIFVEDAKYINFDTQWFMTAKSLYVRAGLIPASAFAIVLSLPR